MSNSSKRIRRIVFLLALAFGIGSGMDFYLPQPAIADVCPNNSCM